MRKPPRAPAPPRPAPQTCARATILPVTFTLQASSPLVAVWWFPQLAAAVLLGQPRQLEKLLARQPPDRRLEPDVVQSGLLLTKDADVIGVRRQPRVGAGGRQRAAQALFQLRAHAGGAPDLQQERQARLATRLARAVVAEDQRDRCAYVRRLVRSHERVERRGEDGPARALLAADGEVEAGLVTRHRRRERDVLRLAARAVLQAAGDGDVELARQVRELLVAEEDLLEGEGDRRGVEQLTRCQPRGRAADDAADVVHPRLEAREACRLEPCDDLRHVLERHPAQLDLLARGDVGDRAARRAARLPGDLAEQAGLRRAHDAIGHAHAHHEMPRRGPAMEDAPPLEPLLVGVAARLPALARETDEVLLHVEAVLLRLHRLDAVHSLGPPWGCPPWGYGDSTRRRR